MYDRFLEFLPVTFFLLVCIFSLGVFSWCSAKVEPSQLDRVKSQIQSLETELDTDVDGVISMAVLRLYQDTFPQKASEKGSAAGYGQIKNVQQWCRVIKTGNSSGNLM